MNTSSECSRPKRWIALLLVAVATFTGALPLLAGELEDCQELFLTGKLEDCWKLADGAITRGAYGESWPLLKSQVELARGEATAARATLEAALERYSWSVRLRLPLRDALRFSGEADKVAELDDEIAKLLESAPWRYTDAENLVLTGRWKLEQGVDAAEVQERYFLRARQNNPSHRLPILSLGQLALEKRDFALAAEHLRVAEKSFPNDPEILFELARAVVTASPEEAAALRERVRKLNPQFVPEIMLQAERAFDAEQYGEMEKQVESVLAINKLHSTALALRSALRTIQSQPDAAMKDREQALSTWSKNPAVDHLIGRLLSRKYRFAEGAAHQRLALGMQPEYQPARKQLAEDLLRLGNDVEGWQLVDVAQKADQYDVTLYNLATLKGHIDQFRTLTRDGLIVRMDPLEADVYGERVLTLLSEAKRELCEKYALTLDQPVVIEIFPNPNDFAVRTFGLPGASGYLGVCFGNVVTANSPASQAAHPSNWEAVLWHEFAHVITLNKTHNRMPRWLSEGISVYEERERNRAWGQQMTPRFREMTLGEELTPISQLSGAFLAPKSSAHLSFAYYESSLVVEFLIDRYGFESLLQILDDLAAGVAINDAIERRTDSLDGLEVEFATFARSRAEQLGKDGDTIVDWSPPTLPEINVEAVQQWVKEHPQSYAGWKLLADGLLKQERWADARPPLERLVELYPGATGPDAPAWQLALVLNRLEEVEAEREVLTRYCEVDADAALAFRRLAELEAVRKNWELVRLNAERELAVNPLHATPHLHLAEAAEETGEARLALGSLRAALQLHPPDPAGLHYRTARLYQQQEDPIAARRAVLMSLEFAPRYRDAQRLLLELVAAHGPSPPVSSVSPPAAPSTPPPTSPAPTSPAPFAPERVSQ